MDNSEGEEPPSEEHFSAKEVAVPHQLMPDPFNSEEDKDKLVNSITAGYYYSAALNSKGEVYTWGSGEFGRLGYGESNKTAYPQILKELQG